MKHSPYLVLRNKDFFKPGLISLSVLFLMLAVCPDICSAEDNIFSFYEKANAKTQSSPDESKLSILCEKQVGKKFVSFIGIENKKALIAAVTDEKVETLDQQIVLSARFTKELPSLPVHGKITDWSYVFDRNKDGKIDYIAQRLGLLPVKQKDFPTDFPTKGGLMRLENIKFYYKNSRLVFDHLADDNFDGKIDGVVLEVMDPNRDWIENWMVISSSRFDNMPDTCWYFRDSMKEKTGECKTSVRDSIKRFRTRRFENTSSPFTPDDFTELSTKLSLLNEAAGMCGLTKDSFYKE